MSTEQNRMRRSKYIALAVSIIISSMALGPGILHAQEHVAQARVSATPVRAVIPTATSIPTDVAIATPTLTWTPTPPGPILLRAREGVETINVRAEPDPNAQLLGQLDISETYRVRGYFFSWYQFDYSSSPTGRAWVFNSLVEIIGDESELQEINPFENNGDDAGSDALAPGDGETTAEPGENDLTLTSGARVLVLPTQENGQLSGGVLPTFTPPPDIASRQSTTPVGAAAMIPTPTPDPLMEALNVVTTGSIPPIVPILILGGAGMLGILVSLIRR